MAAAARERDAATEAHATAAAAAGAADAARRDAQRREAELAARDAALAATASALQARLADVVAREARAAERKRRAAAEGAAVQDAREGSVLDARAVASERKRIARREAAVRAAARTVRDPALGGNDAPRPQVGAMADVLQSAVASLARFVANQSPGDAATRPASGGDAPPVLGDAEGSGRRGRLVSSSDADEGGARAVSKSSLAVLRRSLDDVVRGPVQRSVFVVFVEWSGVHAHGRAPCAALCHTLWHALCCADAPRGRGVARAGAHRGG